MKIERNVRQLIKFLNILLLPRIMFHRFCPSSIQFLDYNRLKRFISLANGCFDFFLHFFPEIVKHCKSFIIETIRSLYNIYVTS